MEIIGRELEVGFAKESTRGTAETTADKWMRDVSVSIVERATKVNDDTTRGRLEDSEGSRKVQSHIEGSVEGVAHADAIGHLINNLYGTDTVTETVASTVYLHTFTLLQSVEHPSFTVFAKEGGVQQLVFDNCMVNTLEISASPDNYVRFNASIIGAGAANNSDTPSYDTEYDFIGKDVTVKIADTEAGLAGASALDVKDITITFDQGLIRDHVLGAYEPSDIYNAKMSIEGEMTLNFTAETFKDLYLSDDAKYMLIDITGAADIGSGENPYIKITLNKVQFMDWNRQGGNDELVTETVSFKAFFNEDDNEASKLELQNLTAAY